MDQLWISPLGPAAWRLVQLVGEGTHGDRDLDATHVEKTTSRMVRIVPVKARRRDRSICQPVERDVVEHIVLAEALRLSVEDASDHLLAALIVYACPAYGDD